MKKKILIVSSAYFPRISPRSFRTTQLAEELSQQGHDVTVLTHIRKSDRQKIGKKENLKVVNFIKGDYKELKKKNIFSRVFQFILKYLLMYPDIQYTFLLRNSLKNYGNYDILISIAVPYPIHWGVILGIKNNSNLCKTWIADCGDPFIGYGHKYGMPFYFRFVNNWFMNNVEFITLPYKELLVYYKEKDHHKIKFIPQGFDFDEIVLSEYKKNKILTFAYAGSFIKNFRDPRLFLEYLALLDIDFKFIVYTRNKSLISDFKEILKEKIEIRDYIPRIDLLYELSKMDFLINIQNGNKKDYPSKLIDYSFTNRPILNVNSYSLNEEAITNFFKGDYSNWDIALKCIDKYDIKNVAKQFLDLTKTI